VAILATGFVTVIARFRVSPSARAENLNFGITATGISLKFQLAATLGAGSHMPLKMVVTRALIQLSAGAICCHDLADSRRIGRGCLRVR
jgi:hypothetical protein